MSRTITFLRRLFFLETDLARGMVCMIGAMLLLPLGDSLSKLLTGTMTPIEVTMWRLVAQSLFLLPLAVLLRKRLRGSIFSPLVVLSGILLITALISLITAFAAMPIATAIAIFFVEPLLLTLLAGPFLGETAGPRRLAAVGVGLLGAMVVIRPGFSEFGWVTLLPLVAATCYALNMIVLRRASQSHSGLSLQCGTVLYATGISVGLVLVLNLTGSTFHIDVDMPVWVWSAILGAGFLAATSYLLIAEAFRRVEASTLAPFQYLEILGATAMGYLVFEDFPDALTWLGVLIILGAGVYVLHRERQADTSSGYRRHAGH